jgi:hypothetical protein
MPSGKAPAGLNVNVTIPEDVTRDTVGFARRILGPLAELADLFGDKVRLLRYKSAVKTLNRAAEIAKEGGFKPEEIPIKFLIPFIEDCSLEQEDSPLIEQWASLLASASKGFDPLHVAIKDVLKNISSKEAQLLETLGSTIDPTLFSDDVSSHQIIEHINVNIRGVIAEHARNFKIRMPDDDFDLMLHELVTLPVIPVFYQIPYTQGVTRTVETNFSTTDKGSIFLLERLEILKVEEARFKLSDDPQISDLVLAYAHLTAFGVEVFQQCCDLSGSKKPKPSKKKA